MIVNETVNLHLAKVLDIIKKTNHQTYWKRSCSLLCKNIYFVKCPCKINMRAGLSIFRFLTVSLDYKSTEKYNQSLHFLVLNSLKGEVNVSNTFLILYSNKLLIFRAGIHKKLVRIANREDPDQTASSETV